MLVRVLQADGRLPHQLAGFADRQRAEPPYQFRQVQSFDVFHHQKMRAVDFPRVVGHDDVRMHELPDRFHLALETGDRLLVLHAIRRQHLQGHNPLELRMKRLVNRPHPAGAELRQEAIRADFAEVGVVARGAGQLRLRGEGRLAPDRLQTGEGLLALRLVEEFRSPARSVEVREQRVGLFGTGGQGLLTIGAGLQVHVDNLRALRGQPPRHVTGEFVTSRTGRRRHDEIPQSRLDLQSDRDELQIRPTDKFDPGGRHRPLGTRTHGP